MDMALCVIDPINKVMEFSGAQNPLIYIQDGQLFRVRGNKFPVGGYQVEEHTFSKHIVNIEKPTTCYIFSDGFPDQFGGPNGRKFMAKNFRDLLFEIHQLPMEEQEKILDLVINEWMGNNEQTDDILVIGFKIDIKDKLLYENSSK
jgi:serine phosphatase RsbU (regulator of sigma subunit)